jgi:hypothetical protein
VASRPWCSFSELEDPNLSAKHQRNINKILAAPDHARGDWLAWHKREARVVYSVECGLAKGECVRVRADVIVRQR